MLDQENQIKVEHSTDHSDCPVPSSTTTVATATTDSATTECKFPIEQQQHQQPSQLEPNKNNPSLKDHDYCSPDKNSRQVNCKDKMKQDSVTLAEQTLASHDKQSSQAETLTASECPASTSISPAKQKSEIQNDNKNSGGDIIMDKLSEHVNDGNLSDSSSSSSSLSDDYSDGLVIADPRPKSLAPKDTPSVSRPKPGRGRPPSNLVHKQQTPNKEGSARPRRPRQYTSVTDKSQWITGEDQVDTALSQHLDNDRREKRQRKEVRDPDFSHFTSSDYSSSDAESDDSNGEDDENDPNRPWCTCMKPHGGQFMICCDICAYWYHGMCVGVTEQMSKRFEREKKEWHCGECQTHLQDGTPRHLIPTKIVKKEKKSKAAKSGKRGRGRPRKSDVATRESARLSSRLAAKRPNTSLDSRLGTRKNPNKYDAARRESFELFGDEQRLKGLIRERKQAFFIKRQLAEKERLARMKELGMTSQSLTGTLGNSLDSLATSTSSPNMSNLPMNIKSEHKERSKPNIVLHINTKKDGEVTAVVKSKKRKAELTDQVVDDLFTADPIQVSKRTDPDNAKQVQDVPGASSTTSDRRGSNGSKSEKHNVSDTNEHSSPKKKRKDSESSTTNSFGSKDIAKKIKECLESCAKQLKDFEAPLLDKIEDLASDIEGQLNECFKESSQKYLNKYRSLMFNFKKNQDLVKNILSGEIRPARLVRMSPEEMAPHELAKWRERHSKHEIELIKHNAQMAAQQVIVKKTHKGEEVISAPALNDSDDPKAEVNNQETPTTPTKTPSKELRDAKAKISPPGSSSSDATTSVAAPTSGLSEVTKISIQLPPKKEPSKILLSLSVDTTKKHNNFINDMNGKISTDEKNDYSEETEKKTSSVAQDRDSDSTKNIIEEPKIQPSEPKRFRVSIETSLDPANLSRLRDQPLIKPSERPPESGEHSPSKMTPTADSNSDAEVDEELYDPETILPTSSVESQHNTNKIPWQGHITMADVGKFAASISPVSGDSSFMRDEISQNLLVCGRIRPDQVSTYVKQIKATTKNEIISIQFHPTTDEDNAIYESLFNYLYTRNRYGVIDNKAHNQFLRDFYIIPIHEGVGIPEVSKPIQGAGLDKNHGNCLLGLMVKTKRPTSALGGRETGTTSSFSSATGYAPAPIK